ncbi:MAG: helix-turn-helix domain-containing protein [Christensenellales bacterium]
MRRNAKKGQHLRMEDRGAIKVLKKQGLGTRAIARHIGCAPSTVTNELRRGTPTRKSNKGKAPGYSPKLEKLSTEPTEHLRQASEIERLQ